MANYISTHTGAQMDAAIDKAHSHPNKALLDTIPTAAPNGWVLTKSGNQAVWAQPQGSGGGSSYNIQGGRTSDAVTIPSGKYIDVKITFPTAYQSVPFVSVCFETSSTAGNFGRCCCAVLSDSVTKTGFTVRCYNGDSSNRGPYVRWMAYGI